MLNILFQIIKVLKVHLKNHFFKIWLTCIYSTNIQLLFSSYFLARIFSFLCLSPIPILVQIFLDLFSQASDFSTNKNSVYLLLKGPTKPLEAWSNTEEIKKMHLKFLREAVDLSAL